jgi:hypothetical protein
MPRPTPSAFPEADHAAQVDVAIAFHADKNEDQRDQHRQIAGDHAHRAMVGDEGDADEHAENDDDAGDGAINCNNPAHDPVSPNGECHARWTGTTAGIYRPNG